MVKFIKVNDIPTHEVLIIPVEEMLKIQASSATVTQVRYGTTNTSINIISITHAPMGSSSDTAMGDWLTKQFIAANQRPWSEPMYNVSASDAPYSISNIVLT
tara:strand:- start:562 stop:867 length:306 start_codon:yes stop_codon:yes gene_type:complete